MKISVNNVFLILVFVFFVINNAKAQGFREHIVDLGNDNNATNIIQGDIDGDGDLDLITFYSIYSVSHSPDDIRLYENKGNDQFERHVLFNKKCSQATLGDVDGDGDLEIIASLRTEDRVVYYNNLGNFKFSGPIEIDQFCEEAYLVAAGDFDGDGDVDVATGSIEGINEVAIRWNDGVGNFPNETRLATPTKDPIQFIVGDVDTNGIDDLAYRRYQDDDIILYSGIGGGNFNINAYNGTSSLPVNHFCFTDEEQDGVLEIAFIDDTKIRIIKNLLSSTSIILVDNFGNYDNIASGDIDGDGDDDLILNGASNASIFYINDISSGGAYTQNLFTGIPTGADLISGDYDQDGIEDIAYPGYTTSFTGVTKFKNDTSGVFVDTTYKLGVEDPYEAFDNPRLCSDIDNDGDFDIITKQGWYENLGEGVFSEFKRIIHDTLSDGTDISDHFIVAIEDIDNDGVNDLVIEEPSPNGWYWVKYSNTTGQLIIPNITYNEIDYDLTGRTLVDLDGDGDKDLIGYENGILKWIENDYVWFGTLEQGAFDPTPNPILDSNFVTVSGYVEPQSFGDIDNDGDLDLFGLQSGDSLYYYENYGNASFSQKQVLISNLPSNTGNIISTADMNKDGRVDVIARTTLTIPNTTIFGSALVYYANEVNGFTGPHYIDSTSGVRAYKPFLQWGDVSGDGYNDLFSTYSITTNNRYVGWNKNQGDGTFNEIQFFNNMDITSFPAIEDIDGDGDLDLLAYSLFTAKTSWLENLGDGCVSSLIQQEEYLCIGGYTTFGDSIITKEGTYIDTLLSTKGCDSIVILDVRFTNEFCETNQCSEIIISEYFEGSANNQAIELYNPTNQPIDLSNYAIGVYSGSSTIDSIIQLTGTIFSDSTFVVGNANASLSSILNASSILSTNLIFDGNDPIVLYKNGKIIDRVGGELMNSTVITDGLLSTQDQTLIRLPSVTSGLIPPSADSLSYQFSSLGLDNASNLLVHTSNCQQYLCNSYTVIDSTICLGDSVFFSQDTLTYTGIYTDTLINTQLCDSIISLRLKTKSNHTFIYDTICFGDSLLFNGKKLSQKGVYHDTLFSTNGCDSLIVLNLDIKIEFADFSGLNLSYSILDSADLLIGNPSGGLFSGPGISNNSFDPNIAGVGTHKITYTYNYGACLGIKEKNVIVENCLVNFSGMDSIYTISSSSVVLVGNPTGGVFTGNGISGNTFSPSIAGIGNFDIVYSYDSLGCVGSDTQSVSIINTPAYNYELIISSIYDGPLTGGTPKGIELYVAQDIADLSLFGIGSANNGGGTDGVEFTFPPVSVTAGSYLYISSESTEFLNFFGIAPSYVSGAISINGDDAVELFKNGVVIDVFGEINVSGVGQPWEYLDGWASRKNCSEPNNGLFSLSEWNFSGINALDGEIINATASTPVTIGVFDCSCPPVNTTIDTALFNGDSIVVGNSVYYSPGTYYDTLLSSLNCDSIITTNITTTTNIFGIQSNKVKIYPNPNNGKFTIEFFDRGLDHHIAIVDVLFKRIKDIKLQKHKQLINLELESGVYFILIDGEIHRIIIEN